MLHFQVGFSQTFIWITRGAAVVLQAQGVSVRQKPACRAVHVAVTGSPAAQVPKEYASAPPLSYGYTHN